MIEAELKARVHDAVGLRRALRRRGSEEIGLYRDTYYDRPDRELTEHGREVRLRVVETGSVRRAILTYKEPPVDVASGSKPEHETFIADESVVEAVLLAAGLERVVSFEKHCANYRFTEHGRDFFATIATVPEISGTFIELETMVSEAETSPALNDVRAVLHDLGITDDDLTTEQYTEAVIRARVSRPDATFSAPTLASDAGSVDRGVP